MQIKRFRRAGSAVAPAEVASAVAPAEVASPSRTPVARRFPLLRPFPLGVFATGAAMIAIALSTVQTSAAGSPRSASVDAAAPLVAQAGTAHSVLAPSVAGASSRPQHVGYQDGD